MLRKSWNKVLLFTLSLLPLCWVAWRYWRDDLTANPIEYTTHFTGDRTIRFLVLTLAITHLRKALKVPERSQHGPTLSVFKLSPDRQRLLSFKAMLRV
jgi:sulfoxide reductase heme-binding subunit YedZ